MGICFAKIKACTVVVDRVCRALEPGVSSILGEEEADDIDQDCANKGNGSIVQVLSIHWHLKGQAERHCRKQRPEGGHNTQGVGCPAEAEGSRLKAAPAPGDACGDGRYIGCYDNCHYHMPQKADGARSQSKAGGLRGVSMVLLWGDAKDVGRVFVDVVVVMPSGGSCMCKGEGRQS
jgi:hypothetical protein